MTAPEQLEFTVEDLPRFSPWPSRLLGLAQWRPLKKKTPDEVTREFDRDKWGRVLERFRAVGGKACVSEVDDWLLDSSEPTLCSSGARFELLTPRQALERHHEVVARTLSRLLPGAALVELGAGYGSVILKLATDARFRGVPLYAAEYTRSGAELMRGLAAAAGIDMRVGRCDLSAEPLSDLSFPQGSIVFTCMAAHYIPCLDDRFVRSLGALRAKAVVHFEPCYEHCNAQTLTGALRRRYIEVNDYNRNLVTVLQRHAAQRSITIIEETPAVIGVNPLLPISVVAWNALEPQTPNAST
jgi:YD repeat-containing protein